MLVARIVTVYVEPLVHVDDADESDWSVSDMLQSAGTGVDGEPWPGAPHDTAPEP